LLVEFRRLADLHGFQTVDARGTVSEVFQAMVEQVSGVVRELSPAVLATSPPPLDVQRAEDARR
jgi:hypothetical protein